MTFIRDRYNAEVKLKVNNDGSLNVFNSNGFGIPVFDDIVLGYTGDDLTSVVYKKDSVVVATLTLSYTDGKLTGVTKS